MMLLKMIMHAYFLCIIFYFFQFSCYLSLIRFLLNYYDSRLARISNLTWRAFFFLFIYLFIYFLNL